MASLVSPNGFIVLGIVGAIAVNILAVVFNLLIAMFRLRGTKDEKEVEERMVPALQGVPAEMGARSLGVAVVALRFFVCVAIVGALWGLAAWLARNV